MMSELDVQDLDMEALCLFPRFWLEKHVEALKSWLT